MTAMVPHPSDGSPFARITLGVDGRLYWHDLTPGLLEIAATICPDDPALRARLAARAPEEAEHEHDANAA